MIRWLISKKLAAAEVELGVPQDYLRYMLRVSLRAFFKFVKFIRLSAYRRSLSPGPFHVARIVATRDADCGPCVQVVVNLARKDGVPSDILRAVVAGEPDKLPEELRDAYLFAEAVARATGEEDMYRDCIRRRHGEEGLIELAMAIAMCRVFPVTKRALGYAVSCSRVSVQI